jgi:hypothetical protein
MTIPVSPTPVSALDINIVALNPQPLPPGIRINLVGLNPQPLPPDATISLLGPVHRRSRKARRSTWWP